MLNQEDLQHYSRSRASDYKFWQRLGGLPDVKGKVILDIGCGWGGLCVELAQRGAKRVIGVDLTESRIRFCQEHVSTKFPELQSTIDFHCCEVASLALLEEVDIAVSKDTFEHVLNLEQLMEDIAKALKPGGILMSGFGPLYYSYFGDHKATGAVLPWFHLVLPEQFLVSRLNKKRGLQLNSIQCLGLNQLKLSDYQTIFARSPLSITYFKTNGAERLMSRIFRLLACVPFLREYFTQSIYMKMQK